ncbi:SPOC domain-containing protein 1 isoform X2 [Ochotona princeps]|uniref:SPOC domain-containing protein 1 isoform X2 n=1 Tax=Ochotona princeps TaxID=9978 RepID=UPI00271527AF|nr:SPOC domain-containing protein 1 isoform X2 [Ochotona princeps]
MSQARKTEGSSPEEAAVLSPAPACRLSQEDIGEANSKLSLAWNLRALPRSGSRKRVWEGKTRGNASSKAGGTAEIGLEGSMPVAGSQSPECLADPRPPGQLPAEPAGRQAQACRKLCVALCDFLAERCVCCKPAVPQKALPSRERPAGVEKASGSRSGGLGSPECDRRTPTLSRDKSLRKGPALKRARRSCRTGRTRPKRNEGAGSLLQLDASPSGNSPQSEGHSLHGADLAFLGGTCSPFYPAGVGSRSGDARGCQTGCAPGPEMWEQSPSVGAQTPSGSLSGRADVLMSQGDRALPPATQAPPLSSALGLGESGQPSEERGGAELRAGAAGDHGPVTAQDSEQQTGSAELVPCTGLRQELVPLVSTCSAEPPGSLSCPLEPGASTACSGPFMGPRKSKLRRGLEPGTQEQDADRRPADSGQREQEESGTGSWSTPLGSGPVVHLLGATSHRPTGGQPMPKLEALKDLTEVISGPSTKRHRRKKEPLVEGPTECQCGPVEAEAEEALPRRTEVSGKVQLQSLQQRSTLDPAVQGTVVRAIHEALRSRLPELPDLALSEEAVEAIATSIEAALLDLTQGTNGRYKSKYRSLLFNLRDPRNPDLFLKIIQGEVTPHDLVRMTSIQLAPQELSRWRDQEEKRVLEVIEQHQQELCGLPASKLTHKGEVEIPRDDDQTLTLEDLVGFLESPDRSSPPAPPAASGDTTEQHEHHFLDPNCRICTAWNPMSELPGFLKATKSGEDGVFQRTPSPATVAAPEASTKPQDRSQMPAGSTKTLTNQPLWEGMLDMFSIKRFRVTAQLVLGHSCQLAQALPEVIRSAGCIPPNTIWDLLASIEPAKAKDTCVLRLCPHGARDTQNCRLLYSYLNNKQRHGLAAVQQVGMVLLPLPAFQPLPSRLRPLGGPGLEVTHSSLLLAVLLPKEGLPDTAGSNPLWGKVRKVVSFSRKVEMKCYQPEDRRPATAPRSSPQPAHGQGSLVPRGGLAWQRAPRGRGRLWVEPQTWQGPGQGQQPREPGWCQFRHSYSVAPAGRGFGRGQNLHQAFCPHQALLQHLESLVSMSHQLQASLWPAQEAFLLSPAASVQPPSAPGTASSPGLPPAAAGPPGSAPDPSLGPAQGDGSEHPLPGEV